MNKFPSAKQLPKRLLPIRDASLAGAACAGYSPLFDSDVNGESKEQREARHHQARSICRQCPVLTECTTTAGTLPKDHRQGIWAGMWIDEPTRHKGTAA
ncbi:WhiB family transcriptional regulator [Corynebacterium sp. MSK032]|uniref:WhiB family transcriptional regulator n=1 Tax=unclassified Corynebacterium TaxID=2624378 RepID=UPI001438D0DF